MYMWISSIAPTTPDRLESSKNCSIEFCKSPPLGKVILCLSSTLIVEKTSRRMPATVDFSMANNFEHYKSVTSCTSL